MSLSMAQSAHQCGQWRRMACTTPRHSVDRPRAAASLSELGTSVKIEVADPKQWWPAADLHCKVFLGNHHERPRRGRVQVPEQTDADTLLAPAMPWVDMLARVDRISALSINEGLARTGAGRTVLLLASSSSSSSSSNSVQDACSTSDGLIGEDVAGSPGPGRLSFPRPLFFVKGMVPAPASQGVGCCAESCHMVGSASLDSFGDLVPPRSLDMARDGAVGWLRREGVAYLSNVAVLPAARRQGVAKRLVQHAEAMAAEWGCRSIGLHVNPTNAAAVQLYRSMGYRKTRVLEAPWMPYLQGRPPHRCMFMLKRLSTAALHSEP